MFASESTNTANVTFGHSTVFPTLSHLLHIETEEILCETTGEPEFSRGLRALCSSSSSTALSHSRLYTLIILAQKAVWVRQQS